MNNVQSERPNYGIIPSVLLASICFFAGISTVYIYTLFYSKPAQTIVKSEATPASTPFQLSVPSQAISGVLKELHGTVLKFSRNDSDYMESTKGAQILLGESIATRKDSSAEISLSDILTAALGENSELVFANTFRENSVLQQKSGKIFYSVESLHPVSVRALHTLVSASSSAFLVTITDSDIAVTAQSGVVKVALVDTNNDTHVWELEDGQRMNIDDISKTTQILSP
jgi:FecR protein